MSDTTKSYVKKDTLIMLLTAGYFTVTYPFINEDYSSGYQSIRDYFIFQNSLAVVF